MSKKQIAMEIRRARAREDYAAVNAWRNLLNYKPRYIRPAPESRDDDL